jgi:acyl carrier protein
MRTRPDLENEVLVLMRAELDLDQSVPPEAELDQYLDSLQRVQLVLALEDHFHVRFGPEEDRELRTLADTVRTLRRKLAES